MQGMEDISGDQDAPDLANVLYYAKQERDDIGDTDCIHGKKEWVIWTISRQ